MKKIPDMRFALVLPLALATLPLLAHGGGAHIQGTIAAVDDVRLVLRTPEGKAAEVRLTEKTQFVRGTAPAGRSEMNVGERVVVHTGKGTSPPEAVLVRLGTKRRPAGGEMPIPPRMEDR